MEMALGTGNNFLQNTFWNQFNGR